MKDYSIKMRSLLVSQNFRCASCNKKFKAGDKIELAHKVKAGKYNYKKYGKGIIDHVINLAATHPGKCNDKQNMSRAAHPIEAEKLIINIKNCILTKS
jgi:hypothetical protein